MPPTATDHKQRLQEIRQEMGDCNTQARQVMDQADKEERDLTAEEQQKVDKLYGRFDELHAEEQQLEQAEHRRNKLQQMESHLDQSPGRQSQPPSPSGSGGRGSDPGSGGGKLGVNENGQLVYDLGHPGGEKLQTSLPLQGPEAERDAQAYIDAWASYVANGQPSADLQTASDPRGGYLAPTRMAAELIRFVNDDVFMRRISRVLPPLRQAVSLGIPSHDSDPGDADWTPEVPSSQMSEDGSMRFGRRELQPHLKAKLIRVSMKLLRNAVIDVESLIRQRLGYKFSVTEEKAFLTGDGAQKPLGVFTASNSGISTTRDVSSSTSGDYGADDVIDTFYALKAQYMRRATWIFHRDHIAKIRKLKDNNGNYIWRGIGDAPQSSQDLVAGAAGLILDRPYMMSEFAPNTIASGNYAGIIGDFARGYWIVDSLQMEIQRLNELFAATNEVGLIGRGETDGMPVLEEAFSRLKITS